MSKENKKNVKDLKTKENNDKKGKDTIKKTDSKKDKILDKKFAKIKVKYIILIVAILLVASLGGFIGYKYYESNKSVGSDWGDTYFNFIKDSKNGESSDVKIENNSKFEFIQVPDVSDPVMVVNYEKEEVKHSDVYYINDGEVKNVIDLGLNDVKLLYNIEEKKYDWYGYTKNEDEEKYVLLSNKVNKDDTTKKDEKDEKTEEDTSGEYTFKEGEEISVDTVSGEKISIPKFDTVFIEPEVKVNEVEYDEKMTDKELKEVMTDGVKEYKETEKITNKDVKKEVEEKEKAVISKQEEIKKAEEEVKKKQEEERKKAEEARRRAEEEAKKGLKVGNYTLKYGTYKSEYDGEEVGNNGRYTIKRDGTYTYTKPNYIGWDPVSKKRVSVSGGVQESGTYEAKTTYDGIGPNPRAVLSICFNPTSSNVKKYETFSDGVSDECFEVSSNNSWNGVQYPNKYTYIG